MPTWLPVPLPVPFSDVSLERLAYRVTEHLIPSSVRPDSDSIMLCDPGRCRLSDAQTCHFDKAG